MSEAECDFSGLPAASCAHCTGATLADPRPYRGPSAPRITARTTSPCGWTDCDRRIEPGDAIVHTSEGWCHDACTTDRP